MLSAIGRGAGGVGAGFMRETAQQRGFSTFNSLVDQYSRKPLLERMAVATTAVTIAETAADILERVMNRPDPEQKKEC